MLSSYLASQLLLLALAMILVKKQKETDELSVEILTVFYIGMSVFIGWAFVYNNPSLFIGAITIGIWSLLGPVIYYEGAKRFYSHYHITSVKSENKKVKKHYLKNYSDDYNRLIKKLTELVANNWDVTRTHQSGTLCAKSLTLNHMLLEESRSEYFIRNMVMEFINFHIINDDNEYVAKSIEESTLDKNNLARIALIVNVLGDKDKLVFMNSSQGNEQFLLLCEDLDILNKTIQEAGLKAREIIKQTHINEMNNELNNLRSNDFSEIKDILSKEKNNEK